MRAFADNAKLAPVSAPQREHPRYAHEAAIALHTPDQAIFGRTRNVSRGGLCATLAEPMTLGTEVALDIQLVFEDRRQSEPLRLPGRVVWCTQVGERFQIGVQYMPLDAESGQYLTMFLRFLRGGQDAEPESDDEDEEDDEAPQSVDDLFR